MVRRSLSGNFVLRDSVPIERLTKDLGAGEPPPLLPDRESL